MISASEQRLSVSPQKLTNEPTRAHAAAAKTWNGPDLGRFLELELTCKCKQWGHKVGGAWSPQGEGGQEEAPVVAHR